MKNTLLPAALLFLAVLVGAYCAFQWTFCRFYVAPGMMAVVTAKNGAAPAGNDILVKPGEKGIWEEVLPEGRHFLNPINYEWEIVRAVTIPLGKVGIVTSKVGRELPTGEIIAPDHESKGIWRDVLGPGVYRLNPYGYSVQIVDAINIPIGYVGIVTAQTGKPAAPGAFARPDEKGVLRDVLQPGLYYINPLAYQINVIEIGMNQVSMEAANAGNSLINAKNRIESADDALDAIQSNVLRTQMEQRMKMNQSAAPKAPAAPAPAARGGIAKRRALPQSQHNGRIAVRDRRERRLADKGESDVSEFSTDDAKEPTFGLAMPPADKANAAIFGSSRLVEFPSRDGFKIRLEMTVEFELMPENISRLYLAYGDLPQVVEKIILPQVLSVSRMKGSNYRAQDFIMGEGRETFQNELKKDLSAVLAEKYVLVRNAIIRNVEIPEEILAPIRTASLAKEQNLTNAAWQDTAKIEAKLNTEVTMIAQKKQEVAQETKKLVAEITANRGKEIATIKAQTGLDVAELQLKKAEILAATQKLKGETEAKAQYLVDSERAKGAAMLAKALGSGAALAEMQLVDSLGDEVQTKIIYAGPGTMWTDLKNGAVNVGGDE